jgi:hypothetical protein
MALGQVFFLVPRYSHASHSVNVSFSRRSPGYDTMDPFANPEQRDSVLPNLKTKKKHYHTVTELSYIFTCVVELHLRDIFVVVKQVPIRILLTRAVAQITYSIKEVNISQRNSI